MSLQYGRHIAGTPGLPIPARDATRGLDIHESERHIDHDVFIRESHFSTVGA